MGHTIVIFSALYAPSMGGIELFTQNLTHELVREGHRPILVTSRIDSSPIHEETDGLEIFRLPCLALVQGRFPLPIFNSAYRTAMDRLRALEPYGVLVQTRFYPLSLIGLSYARAQGVRPVLLDHGSDYLGFGDARIDWLVRRYERAVTALGRKRKADYYGISQKSAAWLGNFGISARGTISNAVDVAALHASSSGRDFRAELGIAPETLVAAFTGRLVPDKGTGVLVETARLLEQRGLDAQILVAGDGPELERMRMQAGEKLRLLGRLDHADISALLACSNVFLFPSNTEGMPTSLLEAAAWGLPAIATDVGGVREIMPGREYGWVLEQADAGICAEHLAWCSKHRNELARMGQRCRARVEERFSWGQTAASLLAACESARR